uniref:Uncharacterized protein n=1 Tax=Ananas comosus var. bracteatus TaxID=296719 RepID=A0A6V7QRG3_ANACO
MQHHAHNRLGSFGGGGGATPSPPSSPRIHRRQAKLGGGGATLLRIQQQRPPDTPRLSPTLSSQHFPNPTLLRSLSFPSSTTPSPILKRAIARRRSSRAVAVAVAAAGAASSDPVMDAKPMQGERMLVDLFL